MKRIAQIVALMMIMVLAIPVVSFADTKGSTQYLVNQAKYYEGKTLAQVKNSIKAQGYKGWNMGYGDEWCAWYVSNCANAAFVGNYYGMTPIKKGTFVHEIADSFASFNKTQKVSPGSYSPKAGDIVVENNGAHVGIMVSSTKAAFGNDGSNLSWPNTTVKIRRPVNVAYYVPRPNWYQLYYSDDLKATSVKDDMAYNSPQIATFGKSIKTRTKKFKRANYTYTHYYLYIEDYKRSSNTSTKLFWSKNTLTGKKTWVKSGTKNYTKVKVKVGANLRYNYNIKYAGAKIVLIPVWTKK